MLIMLTQVGISAPQGCGKSTLVEQLQTLLIRNKINTANVSMDDFYLRFQVCYASNMLYDVRVKHGLALAMHSKHAHR